MGAACIAVAPFVFSLVGSSSGFGSLIPGMVVLGIGIGSFYPTATTAGVTSVDESQTSLAGGIVDGIRAAFRPTPRSRWSAS